MDGVRGRITSRVSIEPPPVCGTSLTVLSIYRAVADLGQAWEKVSLRVGRMSGDCRDRYRNHLVNREIRSTGGSNTLFSTGSVF